ncbi:MAG TPA: hypothetical protein VMH40_09015 [Myxococcaceae bacterium]|nr:hypothetical protein [Myxococcaceae bacterium]
MHSGVRAVGAVRVALVVAALLACVEAAAQVNVVVPPSVLLPNYDRVYPGLQEGLEGGAYIARARNAAAVFYNPAGLALTDRTALNASAQGYQLTTVSGTGFEDNSPVSSFKAIPTFVGVALGKDVFDWDRLRLGFAIFQTAAWDQAVQAGTTVDPNTRASYSVKSNFDVLVPAFSVAYGFTPTFRMGLSLEFPYTTVSDLGFLSGEATTATSSLSTQRTLAAGGSILHFIPALAVQWDALPWLALGAVVHSPGIKILSSGNLTYEAITVQDASSVHTTFKDPSADFNYKQPLQVALGVAFRFGPAEIEVDVKWHDGADLYNLMATSQQYRSTSVSATGPPVVTNGTIQPIVYGARQTWNGSVGGHYQLTKTVTLNAGVYMDNSPVAPGSEGFRKVNLIGVRGGGSFTIGKVGLSIGLGWEHGSAADNLSPDSGNPGGIPSYAGNLSLTTLSLLFAVSFSF